MPQPEGPSSVTNSLSWISSERPVKMGSPSKSTTMFCSAVITEFSITCIPLCGFSGKDPAPGDRAHPAKGLLHCSMAHWAAPQSSCSGAYFTDCDNRCMQPANCRRAGAFSLQNLRSHSAPVMPQPQACNCYYTGYGAVCQYIFCKIFTKNQKNRQISPFTHKI